MRLPRRLRRPPPRTGSAEVETARAAAAAASAQAALSEARHRQIRKAVVDPLLNLAEHNQFADLLRRSLIEGDQQ